jgi:hypothetical protein
MVKLGRFPFEVFFSKKNLCDIGGIWEPCNSRNQLKVVIALLFGWFHYSNVIFMVAHLC